MAIEKNSVVEGTVSGITKFGAFINLPESAVGMVHISEVADVYVTDINQHLKVGDIVKVRVLGLNPKGKYDLSIKQVEKLKTERIKVKEGRGPYDPFEDKMTKFLKQSEEKLLDVKRNIQYKQEGKPRKKVKQ